MSQTMCNLITALWLSQKDGLTSQKDSHYLSLCVTASQWGADAPYQRATGGPNLGFRKAKISLYTEKDSSRSFSVSFLPSSLFLRVSGEASDYTATRTVFQSLGPPRSGEKDTGYHLSESLWSRCWEFSFNTFVFYPHQGTSSLLREQIKIVWLNLQSISNLWLQCCPRVTLKDLESSLPAWLWLWFHLEAQWNLSDRKWAFSHLSSPSAWWAIAGPCPACSHAMPGLSKSYGNEHLPRHNL